MTNSMSRLHATGSLRINHGLEQMKSRRMFGRSTEANHREQLRAPSYSSDGLVIILTLVGAYQLVPNTKLAIAEQHAGGATHLSNISNLSPSTPFAAIVIPSWIISSQ
jgi:hypothetical protein